MKWISVKKELPLLHVFVEVYSPKKMCFDLKRSHAAIYYNSEKKRNEWTLHARTEDEWGKFNITYWKFLDPDPYGRIPVLKIDKKGHFQVHFTKNINLTPKEK